jgi:hypothetical protein
VIERSRKLFDLADFDVTYFLDFRLGRPQFASGSVRATSLATLISSSGMSRMGFSADIIPHRPPVHVQSGLLFC